MRLGGRRCLGGPDLMGKECKRNRMLSTPPRPLFQQPRPVFRPPTGHGSFPGKAKHGYGGIAAFSHGEKFGSIGKTESYSLSNQLSRVCLLGRCSLVGCFFYACSQKYVACRRWFCCSVAVGDDQGMRCKNER